VTTTLRNGALTWIAGSRASATHAAVTTTRAAFEGVVLGRQTFGAAVAGGAAAVTGDLAAASAVFDVLDRFDAGFAIVEPRRPQ